jgi:hypothetical protein
MSDSNQANCLTLAPGRGPALRNPARFALARLVWSLAMAAPIQAMKDFIRCITPVGVLLAVLPPAGGRQQNAGLAVSDR